ncbi:MAG: PTS sugar transporter subunit IIC [Elusimicrobiota bacterium]|jgi:PTS system mannose-specific IIC component|nr:PTS sugar transporter subunit IIC [Elusimicrobiota bacterium]
MIIESFVILALIAAIFNTDLTGFGQFMICRPIFCAPIFGFLTGNIVEGLWMGMIVELLWINAVPLGSYLPPDICAISILATVWVNKFFPGLESASCTALLLAIPFGYACRNIDYFGRKINVKIMYWIEDGISKEQYKRINIGIGLGLVLFIVKFFIFYLAAIPLGGFIFDLVYLNIPNFAVTGFKRAWFLFPILGFGSTLYAFWQFRKQRWMGR